MASDKFIKLNPDNFDDHITADLPLLVDFWAPWCGPCRMVAPVLEALAEELDGKLRIGKVNIEEDMDLTARFRVQSVPTFIIFVDGEVKARTTGAMPKGAFVEFIERNI